MNGMERLQNLMAGKMGDRRMFALPMSLYGARLTACPLEHYYNDPAAYARGQAAVRELFQPDILFAPVLVAAIGEAFGSRLRYTAQAAPVVARPAIASVAEWENLPTPDPDRHPRLLYLREALRRVVAEHGAEVPIAAVLLPPIDLPGVVMGLDAWVETVLFDRPAAEAIMRRVIPFTVDLANRCFADGATFVVWTVAFASPGFVTAEILDRFSRPVLSEAMAQLHGPVVLHHLEYPLLPHLENLVGLPAVAGFALAQTDDLSEARRIVGSEAVLLSGPASPWLRNARADEVDAVCRAFLEDRRHDPRFILVSPTGGDVYVDTPPENILAFRRAVEAFAE